MLIPLILVVCLGSVLGYGVVLILRQFSNPTTRRFASSNSIAVRRRQRLA